MAGLPPLRALHVFEVVGRRGSMTKAADELDVSPGAVSQQIKILEDALGMKLITRKVSGLTLTELGRSYHAGISKAFQDLQKAHDDILLLHRSKGFEISALPLLASRWLAPRVFEWQRRHPEVRIQLESTTVEPSPGAGSLDFRITYQEKSSAFDSFAPLFTDSLIPVCSPGLIASGPPLRTPADLMAYRLLTTDWKPLLASAPDWREWFRHAGVECGDILDMIVFSLSSLAIEAAIDGRGVTLAQRALIDEDLKLGRLVTPFPQMLLLPSPYVLAWNNEVFDKRGAREFHRWILGVARQQAAA
jgi:LysR family glycine cleavage system transcriptional activator